LAIGIILGAAVWREGPSPTLRRRTLHAEALYQSGHITSLVLCGGVGQHPPSEAAVMQDILLGAGVPMDAMVLEDQSTTTGENIRFAQNLIDETDVVIITDWYHAPRAKLIARRAGLHATSSSPSLRGAKFWLQTKSALREIPAYIAYAIRLRT
jgi:vancomycin permeability regulator SanA